MSGTLPPMRGEIPARVPLSVRFTPPKPGKFRATFLFRVAKGFPAKVARARGRARGRDSARG